MCYQPTCTPICTCTCTCIYFSMMDPCTHYMVFFQTVIQRCHDVCTHGILYAIIVRVYANISGLVSIIVTIHTCIRQTDKAKLHVYVHNVYTH